MEQPGSEFSDGPHDLQEEAGSNTRRHGATARGWRAAAWTDRNCTQQLLSNQKEVVASHHTCHCCEMCPHVAILRSIINFGILFNIGR